MAPFFCPYLSPNPLSIVERGPEGEVTTIIEHPTLPFSAFIIFNIFYDSTPAPFPKVKNPVQECDL
jgi:hypothetical protein